MQFGILGESAPELTLGDWVDQGEVPLEPFRLQRYDGKVRILYFFCARDLYGHNNGFPLLKQLMARFEDVVFAAVQMRFKGHQHAVSVQRADLLRDYAINIPVGQDEEGEARPVTMRDYRLGGTPWIVIIDKQGKVAFNDGHTGFETLELLIRGLLDDSQSAPEPQPDRVRHIAGSGSLEVDFHGGGIGRIDYNLNGNTAHLVYSEVPISRRGQGLGARLMERAMEEFEQQGLKVHPVCGYTASYLGRYPHWANRVV